MGPTREPTVAWVNWVAMPAEPIAKNQEAAWQFIKFMMETEHEVRPGLPGVRQSNWLRHLEEIVNSGLYHHSYNELAEFVAICLNQFTIPTPRYYVGLWRCGADLDQIRDQMRRGTVGGGRFAAGGATDEPDCSRLYRQSLGELTSGGASAFQTGARPRHRN